MARKRKPKTLAHCILHGGIKGKTFKASNPPNTGWNYTVTGIYSDDSPMVGTCPLEHYTHTIIKIPGGGYQALENHLDDILVTLENLTFLEQGKFTLRTSLSKRVSDEIKQLADQHTLHSLLLELTKYIRDKLPHNEDSKDEEFRKRNAYAILESGYETGCTDRALVFAVLARELGIPAQYVETLSEEWLKEANPKGVRGHVFVDILVDGIWGTCDPREGLLGVATPGYALDGTKYVEIGRGLDFSEIFMKRKRGGGYKSKLTDLQDIQKAALEMRGK